MGSFIIQHNAGSGTNEHKKENTAKWKYIIQPSTCEVLPDTYRGTMENIQGQNMVLKDVITVYLWGYLQGNNR